MKSGIYTITNTSNGHRYVGSAVDIRQRWFQHKSLLLGERHDNIHLQRAWNKYGEAAFKFEVLERWEPEFLISMEQWWMNMLAPEYNILPTAGSNLGMRFSDEARGKMSAARMGYKHTAETRAKISAANMGNTNMLGYKHTAESKAKMSAANKGRKHTLESRANMSAAHKGKPWSPARRAAYENKLR